MYKLWAQLIQLILKKTIHLGLRALMVMLITGVSLLADTQPGRSIITKDHVNHYQLSDTEWIIQFNNQLTAADQDRILESYSFVQSFIHYPSPAVSIVKVVPGMTEAQMQQAFESDASISYAARGLIYSDGTREFPLDRVFVQLKSASQLSDLQQIATNSGAEIIGESFLENLYELKLDKNSSLNPIAFSNQLNTTSSFDWAEPDLMRLLKKLSTNDPFLNYQWSLNNTGAANQYSGTPGEDMDVFNAWTVSTGSSSIKVAILDEGVDLNHPDLAANMLPGYDAHGITAGDAENDDAHGTACAGIVASVGNNSIGTAGVAYDCKIIPIRIAYSDANGNWVTSSSGIGASITWAWQTAGADVLSNSWGGGSPTTLISTPFTNAITQGRGGLGAPCLAAAGNGNGAIGYPALYSDVISVAATSMCGERKNPSSCDGENWWGSDYGATLDISAPGVKIYTTDISGTDGYSNGDYIATFNGTSSACPNAAGVMALILSTNSALTESEAKDIISSTCEKTGSYSYVTTAGFPNGTRCDDLGYGRVNAYDAVQAAAANAACPAVGSFPFTEGFESTSATLACWTNEYVADTADWSYANGSSGGSITVANSGSANARFVSQSGSNSPTTKLVSPVLDLSSLTAPRMSFYYGQQNWWGYQNELKVYYRTSSSGAWTQLVHYTGSVNSWTMEIITLPNPSSTYQIAFEGINSSGHANVIDDITIEESAACPDPLSLSTSNITDVSFDVSWSAGPATGWNVEYGLNGYTLGTGTVVSSASPTTTITGLMAVTAYDVYVQADCGSAWVGPVSATTNLCNSLCTYTINMTDLYGDGWNGAIIDIMQAGTLVGSFGSSFSSGFSAQTTIDLCDLLSTDIIANTPGLFSEEVGFTIVDPFGSTVLTYSAASSFPAGYSFGNFTSYCTLPACLAPFALGVASVTSSSADVYWDANGNTNFSIEYGPAGFVQGAGTTMASGNDTAVIVGLTDNTSYDFYVQSDCGTDGLSAWSGPSSFSTLCVSTAMPYSMDFDSWPPACWDIDGGAATPVQYGGDYMEGSFWNWNDITAEVLSQAIQISTDAEVRYRWSHLYDPSYPNDQVLLMVREMGTTAWDTITNLIGPSFSSPGAGSTTPSPDADFITEIISLDPSYTNSTVEFRMDLVSDFGPNVFIDDFSVAGLVTSCLAFDSIVAVNANLGVYRAYFDTLAGTSWELEYKGINDTAWRSKTINRSLQKSQKFNITPSFGTDVLVRIVSQDSTGTNVSCEATIQVSCKRQNLNIITQIEAFCEGDSVLLRAGYSGGYRTPAFLWSNGATTKRTYVNQGEKLIVTVTDLAGCSVTDSITVPFLNTVGAPTAFNLSKDNATTYTGSWIASSLPAGASLIGYRMAYRQANVGASWVTTSLSSNTTATVDFTGSGNVSANYEFTAFARINDNGSVYNTEYACKDRKFYNGSGGKSDGQSLDENGNTIISIYPNPTNGKVYVQAELGAKIQLFDLQGKLLSQKEALSNETAFDLSSYAKGVYMMKVTTDERVVSEQVMKN